MNFNQSRFICGLERYDIGNSIEIVCMCMKMFRQLLLGAYLTLLIAELSIVRIAVADSAVRIREETAAATRTIPITATTIAGVELRSGFTTESTTNLSTAASQSSADSNTTNASSIYTTNKNIPNTPINTTAPPKDVTSNIYCIPSLCELYNGSHVLQVPHTGCNNDGAFAPACGAQPHLLYMSQRRRQFILDMHNLARERIASGQLEGYRSAAHMPMLKWDDELEYIASLHVKRCQFAHDQCRNTPRYQLSGQNIGYFWIGREFKSHAKRFKSFILDWFREYRIANQSFIDQYRPHPEG